MSENPKEDFPFLPDFEPSLEGQESKNLDTEQNSAEPAPDFALPEFDSIQSPNSEPFESEPNSQQSEAFPSSGSPSALDSDFPNSELEKPSEPSLESIKNFSEALPIGHPDVPANYPFTVKIEGPLLPHEKERFLDLLNREKFEIREMDLEPQIAAQKILLPRISEFAAILVFQCLRAANVKITCVESDQESQTLSSSPPHIQSQILNPQHAAEHLPISSASEIPELMPFQVIDTFAVSQSFNSQMLDPMSSSQYQELIEALQKELKYRAYRKGASGIIHFKIQNESVLAPNQFKIILSGTAIRQLKPSSGMSS